LERWEDDETLSCGSRCVGRNLKPRLSLYEAGDLATRRQLSVLSRSCRLWNPSLHLNPYLTNDVVLFEFMDNTTFLSFPRLKRLGGGILQTRVRMSCVMSSVRREIWSLDRGMYVQLGHLFCIERCLPLYQQLSDTFLFDVETQRGCAIC